MPSIEKDIRKIEYELAHEEFPEKNTDYFKG